MRIMILLVRYGMFRVPVRFAYLLEGWTYSDMGFGDVWVDPMR
jgi:hypothetical protein